MSLQYVEKISRHTTLSNAVMKCF